MRHFCPYFFTDKVYFALQSNGLCTLIMKTYFLSYSHAIIWELGQFLSIGGGGGGSLILGAYAKGKSPSFRCPVAEYGYVISTCTVFLLFKLMQT